MAKPLKSLAPARCRLPCGSLLRADLIPPAVMPSDGQRDRQRATSLQRLVDQLDAAAEAEGTTRKVIITRALAKAGFRIPQPDLEDRTPRRRRDRREAA